MVRPQARLLKLQYPGTKTRELSALRTGCLSGQDLELLGGPQAPPHFLERAGLRPNWELGCSALSPPSSWPLGALSQETPWKVVLIQKGPGPQDP